MSAFFNDLGYTMPDDDDDWFDCYYCAGTRLAPDGFHDCPECMGDDDNDDEIDDDDPLGIEYGMWANTPLGLDDDPEDYDDDTY